MNQDRVQNRLNSLLSALKSKEIVDYMNQWQVDKVHLLKLIVESKIGYDQSVSDVENASLIQEIDEYKVYSINSYSDLIMFISTIGDAGKSVFQANTTLNNFYQFHRLAVKTSTLLMKLMGLETQADLQRVASDRGIQAPAAQFSVPAPATPAAPDPIPVPQYQYINPAYPQYVPVPQPQYIPNPALMQQQYPAPPQYIPNPAQQPQQPLANLEPKQPGKVVQIPETQKQETSEDVSLGNFLKSLASYN